jgi:hypothetical protein
MSRQAAILGAASSVFSGLPVHYCLYVLHIPLLKSLFVGLVFGLMFYTASVFYFYNSVKLKVVDEQKNSNRP